MTITLTPKEKAELLVDKFYPMFDSSARLSIAKSCALIAVDEILEAIDWHFYQTPTNEIEYWQEVKKEIHNITE